jgi:hypothetical protein
MPALELSASEWLTIISHVKKWVTNLLRAKEIRKRESKDALRAVINAVRETRLYLRSIREEHKKSIDKEGQLSSLWTDLSFKLDDIKLSNLCERCSMMGRYWTDPALFDDESLNTAQDRLFDIEHIAHEGLDEIEK